MIAHRGRQSRFLTACVPLRFRHMAAHTDGIFAFFAHKAIEGSVKVWCGLAC